MEIAVQATLSCHACGEEASPVNAVVPKVECVGCGAVLALPDAAWIAALDGLRHRAASLAETARAHETLRTPGGTFRVGFSRVPPACPHCEATWADLPEGACPACGLAVHRRAPPVEVEGIALLLAEDRALVLGAEAAGLAGPVSCGSCGAPLEVGGERRVRCGACEAQTVVPDEVWRRSNAPRLTARWVVVVEGEGSAHPLQAVHPERMAVGGDGTLFVVGKEYPVAVITALSADLDRRLWTHELGSEDFESADLTPVPLPDGRVALVPGGAIGVGGSRVLVADAAGVSVLFEVSGEEIMDGALQGDTLVLARGHHRQLHRYDLAGQPLPLWPPVGFFKRLFGGGDGPAIPGGSPGPRPVGTMTGRLGGGADGSLLLTWGATVVAYDREGQIRWTRSEADWVTSLDAPSGASDGTAGFKYATRGPDNEFADDRVLLVSPDGSELRVVVERDAVPAFAVAPSGRVYVFGSDHVDGVGTSFELMVFDEEGNTVRTLPMGG